MSTSVDELIEKGADRLEDASARLATEDGLKARLREELADDARFLRKLKPSAIAARAHGEAPPEDTREAPAPTQLPPSPARPARGGSRLSPLAVIAAAFVAGCVLAKVIEWRGHAHPRL